MNLFNARDELLKLFAPRIEHRRTRGNWPGRTIAGQVFGLTINERLPEVCLLSECRTAPGAKLHAPAGSAAGAFMVAPAASASQDLENANG